MDEAEQQIDTDWVRINALSQQQATCPECGKETTADMVEVFGECQECLDKTWAWWYAPGE